MDQEQRRKIQNKKAKDISKKENKKAFFISVLNPLRLSIGRWKVEGIKEKKELVVKIYFKSKQICYEILWKGCKQKVEIEWSNIMGIRASLIHNEPGILELELTQPPKLYEEIKRVDRREHDKWVDGLDFTEGQAPISRRHLVMFPPGMLDKHFKKLISLDEYLFELSQKPYPTIKNVVYFQQQPPPFLQNHFSNNHQILQLPHVSVGHHHHLTPPIPQISGVCLPSNSMMYAPNSSNPQECSNLRVPQVPNIISNSNGYLWNSTNNDSNIGGSIISNNTNMPIGSMYGDGTCNNEPMMNNNTNPNGSSHSLEEEASNVYFSNLPTDQYGVWLSPPQQHIIAKQNMASQF